MSTNGAPNPPAEKPAADQNTDLSKDQVGWYFVEQYYTTVSKNPEKLHLFYGKKSQFVYGSEAEVAKISVGRQAIQERIKQLDFQDTKVRISNVDTQASYDNIVIQVIGEFSNKGGETKKFVQTFILAQQPSGYFVLNDILRCIDDDESEEDITETQEPGATSQPAIEPPKVAPETEKPAADEPATETPTTDAFDANAIDKKLEEVGESVQTETPTTESITEPAEPMQDTAEVLAETPAAPAATETPDPDAAAKDIAEEDSKEPERPKDPSPTPVGQKTGPPPSTKSATTAPTPAAPPKPMTWASRLAASTGAPRPVVPLKAATPPAPAQTRAPAPAPAPAQGQASAPAPQQTQPPSQARPQASVSTGEGATRKSEPNEWQTAGESSKRQNRPQSMATGPGEKESTSCYVKYVSDKVQQDDLKSALSAHGELTYFDINRQKNCAFAEYATIAAYQAAIAASPYHVNGENIIVEPRRKPGYGSNAYGQGRGGMSGRGRGGFEGGRSGSQGARGGFGPQGGRGRGAPRGSRGSAPVGGP